MLYVWKGRKAHRRFNVVRDGTGKMLYTEPAFVQPGQTLEPRPAELAAFSDLMEPVGQSLKAESSEGSSAGAV